MNFITLGHLLYRVGTLQGIKIYIPLNDLELRNLLQTHAARLNRFVNLLKKLIEIFQLSTEAVHIFYDENTSSISFNRNNALFFNLKYYIELHEEDCRVRLTINAVTYWFIAFCHELAHNFTTAHNTTYVVSI